MFKTLLIAALPALAALAQVTPSEPAPGDKFTEGGDCTISWAVDTTGIWKVLNIQLMTGSNQVMQHLTTVATLDGTKDSSFKYTCPKVTVHSPIYFYQFSTPAAPEPANLTWTGRFAITDATGTVTDPTEETDGVAWGTGALVDPSTAVPAPSYLTFQSGGGSSNTTVSGALNSTVSSTTSTRSTTSAGGSGTTVSTTASGISSVRSGASSGDATDSGNASQATTTASGATALSIDLHTRGIQALVGLAGTALVFGTLF